MAGEKAHSWGEFRQRTPGEGTALIDDEFDAACAHGLTGALGVTLMEALRARYIDRPENPLATEADLRMRAAQRQMIRDLENARDRGLAAIAKRREQT